MMKRDYNAYMMMLVVRVLNIFALQSEGLGYTSQKRKLVHLSQGRVMAKSLEVAFPLTGRVLVVVVKINGGRWI